MSKENIFFVEHTFFNSCKVNSNVLAIQTVLDLGCRKYLEMVLCRVQTARYQGDFGMEESIVSYCIVSHSE